MKIIIVYSAKDKLNLIKKKVNIVVVVWVVRRVLDDRIIGPATAVYQIQRIQSTAKTFRTSKLLNHDDA